MKKFLTTLLIVAGIISATNRANSSRIYCRSSSAEKTSCLRTGTSIKTAGTDKLTIADIGKLSPEEVPVKVNYIVSGTKRGYRPKTQRRHKTAWNSLHLGQADTAVF